MVIQRSVASTFNGTFRLNQNANLELNPRANVVADTGKVLADGDDFTVAGAGSIIPGSGSVREAGALVAESGYNRLTGAFVLTDFPPRSSSM